MILMMRVESHWIRKKISDANGRIKEHRLNGLIRDTFCEEPQKVFDTFEVKFDSELGEKGIQMGHGGMCL